MSFHTTVQRRLEVLNARILKIQREALTHKWRSKERNKLLVAAEELEEEKQSVMNYSKRPQKRWLFSFPVNCNHIHQACLCQADQ